MKQIIIIGSGPAGWTAAVYAARAGYTPIVITGLQEGGQLMTTTDIENWPGGEEGMQAPMLMANMQEHAVRYGTQVVNDIVVNITPIQDKFLLVGDTGNKYWADAVIIATGSSAKYLGLEAEERFQGRGVSACATCDGFFYRKKAVAVVGGGNTAVEEALYLSKIAREVTLVVRGNKLRAEKILQDRIQSTPNIAVSYETVVKDIYGDEMGVTSLLVGNPNTDVDDLEVTVDGVFIAIGHKPNTDFLTGWVAVDDHGYIVLDKTSPYETATSMSGIFAAGDVADSIYRQAITSAGSGCKAALDVVKYLES